MLRPESILPCLLGFVLVALAAARPQLGHRCSSCRAVDGGPVLMQVGHWRSSSQHGAEAVEAKAEDDLSPAAGLSPGSPSHSGSELDSLISSLLDTHASAEEECPAKLSEAKSLLQDLRKEVYQLELRINLTHTQIEVLDQDLASKRETIAVVDQRQAKELQMLTKKKAEDLRTLSTLKAEMDEMRRLAARSGSPAGGDSVASSSFLSLGQAALAALMPLEAAAPPAPLSASLLEVHAESGVSSSSLLQTRVLAGLRNDVRYLASQAQTAEDGLRACSPALQLNSSQAIFDRLKVDLASIAENTLSNGEAVGSGAALGSAPPAPPSSAAQLALGEQSSGARRRRSSASADKFFTSEPSAQVTLTLWIPQKHAEQFIGASGANIKALRKETGTVVTVDEGRAEPAPKLKVNSTEAQELSSGRALVPIHFSGAEDAVLQAHDLAMHILLDIDPSISIITAANLTTSSQASFKAVFQDNRECKSMPGWDPVTTEAECHQAAAALGYSLAPDYGFEVQSDRNRSQGCYIHHESHFTRVDFVWNKAQADLGTQNLAAGENGTIQICRKTRAQDVQNFKPVLRDAGFCGSMDGWRLIANESECLQAAVLHSRSGNATNAGIATESFANRTEGCYLYHDKHFSGHVKFIWNTVHSGIGTTKIGFGDKGRIQFCARMGTSSCDASTMTPVRLGNMSSTVGALKEMGSGARQTYSCSLVNGNFTGNIILTCSGGRLAADASSCTRDDCAGQKADVVQAYTKAYRGLARLYDGYQELASSNASEEAVRQEYMSQKDLLAKQAEKISDDSKDKARKLQEVSLRVDKARSTQEKLLSHIDKLDKECRDLAAGRISEASNALRREHAALRKEASPTLEVPQGPTRAKKKIAQNCNGSAPWVLSNVINSGTTYMKYQGDGAAFDASVKSCKCNWLGIALQADQLDKNVRVGLTDDPEGGPDFANNNFVGLLPGGRLEIHGVGQVGSYRVTDTIRVAVSSGEMRLFVNEMPIHSFGPTEKRAFCAHIFLREKATAIEITNSSDDEAGQSSSVAAHQQQPEVEKLENSVDELRQIVDQMVKSQNSTIVEEQEVVRRWGQTFIWWLTSSATILLSIAAMLLYTIFGRPAAGAVAAAGAAAAGDPGAS